MAFVISFSSTGFEIARERPNPINPIAGESVPNWLRSELQANDDPLCALIERLVKPGQGHRGITVERGR